MNLNDYAKQSREDNDQWWWRLRCSACQSAVISTHKPNRTLYFCVNTQCIKHSEDQVPVRVQLNDRNKGELIALMHSELSEALEGVRKDLMDDKLPNRKMEEVELVDTLIRIFDYAGHYKLDLEGAYQEKRTYNKQRADHKIESRKKLF